jgi:MYXO-CTERM domain-containing protein
MYKSILTVAVISATCTSVASADVIAYWDFEDGVSTILGSYGNLAYAENVFDPLNSGQGQVLEIHEDPVSGTPQAYVAWITGLTDGDIVTGSFMALGADDLGSSSARIWGHYTGGGGDINHYDGSASGNSSYSTAVWAELAHTWTFNGDGGNHDGLVIEARIYTTGDDNGTTWIDDIGVNVIDSDGSGGIEIHFAAVPAPGALAILGLAGLASRRRRK